MPTSSTQHYVGLTIGPIYRTLHPLRRTRAIFAGSYLFSYIMRRIVTALSRGTLRLRGTILIPYLPTNPAERIGYLTGGKGVGLFPDRLLIEAQEGDFERLKNACRLVLSGLARKLKLPDEFVRQYVQLYGLSVMLPKNADTIHELNRLLDNLELRNQIVEGNDPDALTRYLANPKLFRTAGSLMYDALGENPAFPSVPEIALRGLRKTDISAFEAIRQKFKAGEEHKKTADSNKEQPNEDGRLMAVMKQGFGKTFRQYHRYMVIVEADGDRMGKQIGNTGGDAEKLRSFSRKLFAFGQDAKRGIEDYGGNAIYIGGDDLLFFAPVAMPGETPETSKTIFDCVAALDNVFYQWFPKEPEGPTMSYGIAVSYYKFPLNEARETAHKLLKDKAKDDKTRHPQKNAIEFRVLKHSGSYFEGGLDKSADYYERWQSLISTHLTGDEWLTSVIYFVEYFAHLLPNLSLNELKNLFKNRLNEHIHKQNGQFLYENLPTFIFQVYQHDTPSQTNGPEKQKQQTEKRKQASDLIFGTLRFIQFLRGADKEATEKNSISANR